MLPFRASGIFRKNLTEALGLIRKVRDRTVRWHLRIRKMTELARTNGSRLSVGQDCFKAALRQLPPSLGMQIKY
jgi:hypothetical protein